MKKLITVFLLVCIMASFCTVSAFATEGEPVIVAKIGETSYESLQAAINAASSGAVIEITNDITNAPAYEAGANFALLIDKAITINGNNHTVSSSINRVINIETTGDVKINSLNIVGYGERGVNIINKTVNVYLNNVTITANNYAVMLATSSGNSTLSITQGSYTGKNAINIAGPNTKVSISGATITTNDTNLNEGYANVYLHGTSGGSKVTLSGCTFYYNHAAGDQTVSANFVNANGSDLDSVLVDNGGNDYSNAPSAKNMIAMIDYNNGYTYSFATMSRAVSVATSKDVIKILRDVDMGGETVAVDKNITIDASGYKISNGTIKAAEGYTVKIENLSKETNEDALISQVVNVADATELQAQINSGAQNDTLKLGANTSVTKAIEVPANTAINIELPSTTFTGAELKKDFTGDSLFTLKDGASVKITNVTGTDEELKLMRELVSKDYCVTRGSINISDSHGTLANGVCPDCKVQVKAPSTVPATADNSHMILWTVMFAFFAVTAVVTRKKSRA